MSLSSIQTNIAALVKKAYSTDSSASTANASAASETAKTSGKEKDTEIDNTASASAEVKLGETGNTTEIYTAQGLLQQMRQIQLSNTALLYSTGENEEDNSAWFSMMESSGNAELDSMSEDWAETISQNPDKAAVMVEKAKNSSINTMLSGKN